MEQAYFDVLCIYINNYSELFSIASMSNMEAIVKKC